jgi:hypothetical protein
MNTTTDASSTFANRFSAYFDRKVAQKAANSIADGAEVEIRIASSDGRVIEIFTFTKEQGKNHIHSSNAKNPQLVFSMTPDAAEIILSDVTEEIGAIGVGIAKLVVTADANRRVSVKFKAGFFTLFSKGYFGVLSAGGSSFASYLASQGFNGIGAIKSTLKNLKD